MSRLTPSYRSDGVEGIDPVIRDYLDKHFLMTQPNIHISNPKMLVVFSGGNALGKSSLAYKIQQVLCGLVIENDAIKQHLLAYDPAVKPDQLNSLTWKYSMDLYARLDSLTSNGLVVRDGNIDWYFDRVLPVFVERGYELFVIGYDVSKEKRRELIVQRGDKPTVTAQDLINQIDEHIVHAKRFRKVYTPDIMLGDDNLFDQNSVIAALRTRIGQV